MFKAFTKAIRAIGAVIATVSLSLAAWSQSGSVSGQVVQPLYVAPFATVRVCPSTATGTPCFPTASIFTDTNLSIPAPNPYSSDQYGNYSLFASAGYYIVQVTTNNVTYSYTVNVPVNASVSSFSSGDLTPLFTTHVTTATTTPALSFTLSTALSHTVFANCTGSTATPTYCNISTGMLPFTYSGSTSELATVTGTLTNGHCVAIDTSGNLVDSGAACNSLSAYNLIQDEGISLTQRTTLNFIGTSITCADNSGAAKTDCTEQSYNTVQDEGTPLTKRDTINFTGAGVTCSDSGGVTVCNIPSGSGVTGTGTSGHFAGWSSSSSIGDTNFTFSGNTISTTGTGSGILINPPGVSSGNGLGISLITAATTSTSSADSSGSLTIQTANSSFGASTGNINITAGSVSGSTSPTAGTVSLKAGSAGGAATGTGGDILIQPGDRSTSGGGGIIYCDSLNGSSFAPGCNIYMASEGTSGNAVLMAGTGAPSGTCQVPKTNPRFNGMPILYLRTDPTNASTFLYVCIPPNTWTAVTVP